MARIIYALLAAVAITIGSAVFRVLYEEWRDAQRAERERSFRKHPVSLLSERGPK